VPYFPPPGSRPAGWPVCLARVLHGHSAEGGPGAACPAHHVSEEPRFGMVPGMVRSFSTDECARPRSASGDPCGGPGIVPVALPTLAVHIARCLGVVTGLLGLRVLDEHPPPGHFCASNPCAGSNYPQSFPRLLPPSATIFGPNDGHSGALPPSTSVTPLVLWLESRTRAQRDGVAPSRADPAGASTAGRPHPPD